MPAAIRADLTCQVLWLVSHKMKSAASQSHESPEWAKKALSFHSQRFSGCNLRLFERLRSRAMMACMFMELFFEQVCLDNFVLERFVDIHPQLGVRTDDHVTVQTDAPADQAFGHSYS